MKKILNLKYLILSAILAVSFTGCHIGDGDSCPVPEIKTEYKYIKRPMPKLIAKPQFIEYRLMVINFDGKDYYTIPRIDAYILKHNWENYKLWSETNFEILKGLQEDQNGTK